MGLIVTQEFLEWYERGCEVHCAARIVRESLCVVGAYICDT